MLAQHLGGFADLALARQEHQHIAAHRQPRDLVHRVGDRLGQVDLLFVLVLRLDRPVAHLHRVEPAGDLDHRCIAEMLGEALGVDGRRGDDELELGPPGQQTLDVTEQEVDVQAALVRLVDDDRVVGVEKTVGLRLGKEDAVGHHPHEVVLAHAVAEAHAEADVLSERAAQLLCDARSHGARCNPARLGVRDHAGHSALELQADLGQLRGLARSGLAANDHDLVRGDRPGDLVPALADRELLRVRERRQRCEARAAAARRRFDLRCQRCERSRIGTAPTRGILQARQRHAQPVTLAQHGFAELALQVPEVGSGSLDCVRLGCGFHRDGGWPRDRGRVNEG
jgi:hypothetical protein